MKASPVQLLQLMFKHVKVELDLSTCLLRCPIR